MNKKLILPIILGLFLVLSTFSVAAYHYNPYYDSHRSHTSSYSYTRTYESTSSYHSPTYSYSRYNYGGPTYQVDWGYNPSRNHYGYGGGYYGGYYPSYSRYNYGSTYSSYGSSYRTTSYYY
jgi:hypothetical protein